MTWCLSTRASVATALSMHAYVSSCLWVKDFWSTQLVVMCIHNSIYLLYFSLHPQYDHTKVMVINDQAIPFCSKSIIYPFPEIQLFQNVTLKIQGQGHGWGQRTRSHNGTLIANDTYAITNRVFAHENTHPKLWNKIHHKKIQTEFLQNLNRWEFMLSKSIFANSYMFTWNTLHFTQQVYTLRTKSCHHPNFAATNSAGVCQYDITNATIDYNAVSMTTLGPQFKDNQINKLTWMHG